MNENFILNVLIKNNNKFVSNFQYYSYLLVLAQQICYTGHAIILLKHMNSTLKRGNVVKIAAQ